MSLLRRTLSRCTGMLLVCALLAPSMANAAPKPLAPETVHSRLLKAGLGVTAQHEAFTVKAGFNAAIGDGGAAAAQEGVQHDAVCVVYLAGAERGAGFGRGSRS